MMAATFIPEVKIFKPKRHHDKRGFFVETYSYRKYSKDGLVDDFKQDNYSFSFSALTVRGLHFQMPPHSQSKLIWCLRGKIFDVAVDIRRGSATFGKWVGYQLSEENGYQVYIPIGFAHGFMTLEANTEVAYKTSDYYYPDSERSLSWIDPDLAIDWPFKDGVQLSEKDSEARPFIELNSPFEAEVKG